MEHLLPMHSLVTVLPCSGCRACSETGRASLFLQAFQMLVHQISRSDMADFDSGQAVQKSGVPPEGWRVSFPIFTKGSVRSFLTYSFNTVFHTLSLIHSLSLCLSLPLRVFPHSFTHSLTLSLPVSPSSCFVPSWLVSTSDFGPCSLTPIRGQQGAH